MSATTAFRRREKGIALLFGLLTHGLFAVAVGVMAWQLHDGMIHGFGPFHGRAAIFANLLLLLQFTNVHSWLLSPKGKGRLCRLGPKRLARKLYYTSFAAVTSLQLLATFLLWSPSGIVWDRPHGDLAILANLLYGLSWIFLIKAMGDAGLSTQTGARGWLSVVRGIPCEPTSFPEHGTFRFVRQPVYLAFALILFTAPVWTPDHLAIALVWGAYCFHAPTLKERRYARRYGEAFAQYQGRVPYCLPGMHPRRTRRP